MSQANISIKIFLQVQKCQEKWHATFCDTSIDNFTAIVLLIALLNNGKNDMKAVKLSIYNLPFDE